MVELQPQLVCYPVLMLLVTLLECLPRRLGSGDAVAWNFTYAINSLCSFVTSEKLFYFFETLFFHLIEFHDLYGFFQL